MSYKFTTGSVRRGDIYFEDDRTGASTYIDFGQDTITLRPSGSAILYAEANAVGIGTTSPDNTLHVESLGTTHIKIASEAGYEAALKLKSGTQASAYIWQPGNTSDLRFYVNGADVMHLDNDGKVGIGTTNPTYTLDVAGNIGFDEYLRHNDDTDTYLRLLPDTFDIICGGVKLISYYESGNDSVHVNPQNGDVNFIVDSDTEDNSLFVEGSSGNVGIGTGTPYSKLQIAGSLQFNVTVFTANDTLDETHHVAVADCNAASVTLTLPSATAAITGRQYIIKRADSGDDGTPYSLTIGRNSANIDGAGSDIDSIENGTSHTLICIGTSGWILVDKYVGI